MTEKLQTQDSKKGLPENPSKRDFLRLCLGLAGVTAVAVGARTNLGTINNSSISKESEKTTEGLKKRIIIAGLEKEILDKLSDDFPTIEMMKRGVRPNAQYLIQEHDAAPFADVVGGTVLGLVSGFFASVIAQLAYDIWHKAQPRRKTGFIPERGPMADLLSSTVGAFAGATIGTYKLHKRPALAEILEAQDNVQKWAKELLFDEEGFKRNGLTVSGIRLAIRDKIESLSTELKRKTEIITGK